ncbi:UDP-3-O-(3-hydroxymyristoyl)glucosamine N-acyltransferase [Terriglobus roseus]|uniref:UDP-3-O-acylglucosamine N-acyltransferase n=1 Tax=Terriglobus roseus TaxID=392734 RepID=A0A1G7J339_9BACT|nr:UDP-3-O-(3-hydroxymyristoyl)glucosamine N-acyltransferase [Terriglobus roseus]SDF19204.1 UDP-3-O-[3-hydroxymyristoyl] glucosamine N-acyltransferase [Terriglobus roseus]
MKLGEIAQRLGAELVGGNGDTEITGVAGIEHAGVSEITFIANPKYAAQAKTTNAAAILVEPDFPALDGTATLRIKNCYRAFAQTITFFYHAPKYAPGVHPTAVVDPSAKIGTDAHIGAYVVIGPDVTIGLGAVVLPHSVIYAGATIGDRFFAHAHAVVREFCRLGDDVVLQNGAVIGADGFGYARETAGGWTKIVQSGAAVLGDRVEVQANACVDRASIGETRIGDGSKIDNLVQVGHGSTVGQDTLLCAQVGLAGSTEVGSRVILAGQVGVAGHCKVGDGAVATAQSGIPSDVAANSVVSGYPAMDNKLWLRSVAAFARLPEMVRELRSLRKERSE